MNETADRLELVRRAIESASTTGCLEWDEKVARRVRCDPSLLGLTPEFIRSEVYRFVCGGGAIRERPEGRPHWKNKRDYWYEVIIPVPGFKHGVFVELDLTEEDPELPGVTICNAHPELK